MYHIEGGKYFKIIIIAFITARRVRIARTMPWQNVCPSVRHTPVLCLNGFTYTHSFFTSGSPTILVVPHRTGWQYSDGDPPNGGI